MCLAVPTLVGETKIDVFLVVPTGVGENMLDVFLAVPTVVGENILVVFLAVPTVVGENISEVFFYFGSYRARMQRRGHGCSAEGTRDGRTTSQRIRTFVATALSNVRRDVVI